jgi:acetyl-CoA C-acetyltransferase
MGLTAEKLFALSGLTKEDMDRWAVRSHHLAAKAQVDGFFKDEILPIEAEQGDGKTMVVDKDQAVRGDTTMEQMKDLKPAYKPDGVITAGVSSPLNAAATSMVLMSKEAAQKKGIKPLATIRSIGFAGVDPTIMGAGPVPASKKALASAGLQVKDIDFWEINEAFAVVALCALQQMGLSHSVVNLYGGACAIGHPIGASGARLVVTLLNVLQKNDARRGCVSICIGGGEALAMIVERV